MELFEWHGTSSEDFKTVITNSDVGLGWQKKKKFGGAKLLMEGLVADDYYTQCKHLMEGKFSEIFFNWRRVGFRRLRIDSEDVGEHHRTFRIFRMDQESIEA